MSDTRLELHWAAQLIGAVPLAFLQMTPDFSHANLGWIPDRSTFATRRVGGSPPICAGLNVQEFSLAILDDEGNVIDDLTLEGTTLDEGYAWIAKMMDRHGVGARDPGAFHRPLDDVPDHVVRRGEAFTGGDPEARAELARWYDNALLVLSEVAHDAKGASPVRTWPHHFDMATLLTLEAAEDPAQIRSIGLGMTPGDSSYGEPYIYVTPWPYPKDPKLPALEGNGAWHSDGWIGAVLTGSRLIEGGTDANMQAECARTFLASAIPAVRALAGG